MDVPGFPLLRETDTTYEWQENSAYLKAGMFDLPYAVVVRDGAQNRIAETDYAYDEPGYLQSYTGTLPAGTHGAAPNSVRGNPTTISRWLSTAANPVSSHSVWYDTGELYQAEDPLGNKTTYSYDSQLGAYRTQTCSPATAGGAVTHCVSGTYDPTLGLLTSFTDQNSQTTSYDYDTLTSRIKDALAPPDPANGNVRAETQFNYSLPNVFPMTVQVTKPVTTALTDSVITSYDGLGRVIETDHSMPVGASATVITTYDAVQNTVKITNPYFSTSDSTYGSTVTLWDALERPTEVTEPDGSIKILNYDVIAPSSGGGDCNMATDEAGKARRTCSDALGRLVEVDEPGDLFKSTGGISIAGIPAGQANQPIIAGSSLTSFSDSSGEHLFSVGSDQHIYQSYWNGSTWANQDLTAASAGALATSGSPLTSYTMDLSAWGLGQNENIFFLCANQHICSLWWTSTTGNWVYQDVTAAAGGVAAAVGSSLASTATDLSSAGQGKAEFVYYLGANQHVYQLWWNTNTWAWQNQDLTALTSAALAAPGSALSSYATDLSSAGQGLNTFLFYTGANQHVYQLWWNTVNWAWQSADLTALSNGAVAASGSKLTGFSIDLSAVQLGMNELVFYTGANQHIYTLWWSSSNFTWQNQDLTAMTSCPLALATGALTSFADGASDHVYFFGTDQHMNELVWSTGTWSWNQRDLTAGTNDSTAASGSGLTGFADSSGEHVFDVGADLLVDQVAFSNGTWQANNPGIPYVTLYFYDALGNLLCVEQHGNVTGTGCSSPPTSDATSPWRVRRFTYDSLSRLLTAHNPESGTITYSYDDDGNLLQKTSPAPNQTGAATQTISYCYDELNRVTGKAYSAQSCPLTSPVVTYSYDSGPNAKGKLTGITDQAGTASYSYDVLGRFASETRVINGISKSLSYDYNLDGSLKALHYPSGAVITYTPDSAGRMVSAVDSVNNINYVTSAAYQADGQMTGFVSGNGASFAGITNSFSYNSRLQPVNISASSASQTVFSIGYDFHAGNGTAGTGNDNGDVWTLYNFRDRTRDQSFNYDALNRLISAQNAGTNCAATTLNGKTEYWGNTYGYDPWGNLIAKSVPKCSAENLSLTALVNNQLSGYGYDAAGNMSSDPTDGVSATYDAENRIASSTSTKTGTTATYVYDSDGNRVEKTGGGASTLYWYMTPGIIGESDLSGVMKSEYVFFNGERVARRDYPSGSIAYYFSDHLKTASVITDSAGNIKSESDYYPWGGELQFLNNDPNHYKFHRQGTRRDRLRLLRRTLLLQRAGPVPHARLGSKGGRCPVCRVQRSAVAEPVQLCAEYPNSECRYGWALSGCLSCRRTKIFGSA